MSLRSAAGSYQVWQKGLPQNARYRPDLLPPRKDWTGYTASLLRRFLDGARRVSPVALHGLVTALSPPTPPKCCAASLHAAFARNVRARPSGCSTFEAVWVHLHGAGFSRRPNPWPSLLPTPQIHAQPHDSPEELPKHPKEAMGWGIVVTKLLRWKLRRRTHFHLVRDAEEPENLRARAAISLGAVLEQADMDGFEVPDDVPIFERTFRNSQDTLHRLYLNKSNPKEVRRRILEASVRAPQDWHQNAIMAAYSSGDKGWMLTAVFSMRWVRGFDNQILEALKSADSEIHYQAVNAAGNWELNAAWPHIIALLNHAGTPKPLLLAAASSIRLQEAGEILIELAASDDEEIAEAADEAIAMSEPMSDEEDDEDDASD